MATLDVKRPAEVSTVSFREERPQIVGPDEPEAPFPILLAGPVQRGFGRGGKDLGCPTANLPDESLPAMSSVTQTGVYYGYARVYCPGHEGASLCDKDSKVLPMVMSLGWNPFYKNERMTAEIHLLHEFEKDFYGYDMKALVLGYIRPELDYTSRESLVEDINTDKRVALNSLARPGYEQFMTDPHFGNPTK
ncbi:riboflavin kinase [Athelia psychrophila]|uniref:Riboflavin kinase n=1 Tax=Athelia psychrophila TaxID=1759441 RepID=A0A166N383_9AGAM|nr:riboflavin kinase [Fibularhizoctonia sp. CBS 109695]